MKVIAPIMVYKRPGILRVCMEMMPDWMDPIFAVDPYDPELGKIIQLFGKKPYPIVWVYHYDTLSMRMSLFMQHVVRRADFDYMMNLGSDNVIHPDYKAIAYEQMNKDADCFGLGAVDVYHQPSGEAAEWWLPEDAPQVFGAGRCISRKVIDKLGSALYPNDLDRGLDTASQKNIEAAGFTVTKIMPEHNKGLMLDIKTNQSINPFELITHGDVPRLTQQHIYDRYGIGDINK